MAKEPYKYFRIEAREILDGLSRGALELGKGSGGAELVAKMLRLAHTLKGASRVVRLVDIAERAHAIEDLLARHRAAAEPVPKSDIDALLRELDAIAAGVAALDAPAPPASPPVAAPAVPIESVRVEREEVDRLLFALTEAAVQLNTMRAHSAGLERARELAGAVVAALEGEKGGVGASRHGRAVALGAELKATLARVERGVAGALEQVGGELEQVRDAANKLRLAPASSIFGPLERAVRDAADTLDRRVTFHATGGEGRLDAHVLTTVASALMHVVRNAVAHGIEPPPQRSLAGKQPSGSVTLSVTRRGGVVSFRCADDGRGVDVAAVAASARAAGVITDAEARVLTPEAACRLLLRGGLSTERVVSGVSGRGVGLDVVRETAARLRGEVRLESEPGRGTVLEISVPVSLSSVVALIVEAGATTAAIPLEAVERASYVSPVEIVISGPREFLPYGDETMPLVDLARILGEAPGRPERSARSVIVVRAGERRAAFAVDRLLGVSNEVALSLPPHAEIAGFIAAASLDAEGAPRLVLDPDGLVAAAARIERLPDPAAAPAARVLVVDDSLTTRMLEQAILESAGYEVDLATSAEEALVKARERRYGVFVVDVEMPGMDGFEFVAKTRADAELRLTPAILVTSRAAPEDLRRGREAGASAYILKSEFDQGTLLTKLGELFKRA